MELKPCPLCGGNAGYDKSHKVSCRKCGLSVEKWANNRLNSNKEGVKELWNNRPQNQKLRDVLKEIADDYARSVTRSVNPWEKFHNHGQKIQQVLDEIDNT